MPKSASRVTSIMLLVLMMPGLGFAAVDTTLVRHEIEKVEQELLRSKLNGMTASTQLIKIRKLLTLQKKEIELSRKKIEEFNRGLSGLSAQKTELQAKIDQQKVRMKTRLRDLMAFAQYEPLDLSWLLNADAENQKVFYLSKSLKKDLSRVKDLKQDMYALVALELKILEEKSNLDYYANELHDQMALLSANELAQDEIIKTNRSSRLEALRKMKDLRESETQLQTLLSQVKKKQVIEKENVQVEVSSEAQKHFQVVESGFNEFRGRLELPVLGEIVSGFGKNFDSKTNLLTFQKGIQIQATPSLAVKSVAPGVVVFAGPLNHYGQLVIVEHPGEYFTLYGQMSEIAVEQGTTLRGREILGKSSNEPFYFEIRQKNIAVNPMQWLIASSQSLITKR